MDLSEQQLVSCDKENHGCNGGWMDTAFEYNQKTGLVTDELYPYVSGNGHNPKCNQSIVNDYGILTNQEIVPVPKSNEGLQEAISNAAVAVAVDASEWYLYKSGVFNECGRNPNHGVIAVGYEE